jgi:hypothetical protein
VIDVGLSVTSMSSGEVAQPRLGMLAFLDIPVDCRMSGAVEEGGDVRFTVGGQFDEFDIVFEPAALDRFMRLGFELLCRSARVNPQALAGREEPQDSARFAFGAEALRMLAALSDGLAQAAPSCWRSRDSRIEDSTDVSGIQPQLRLS